MTALLLTGTPTAVLALPVTMINNGPSDNRIDIVFLGDGYTSGDLNTTYAAHIGGMVGHLFNAGQNPYPRYANFFNVHRIDVVSNERGADVPAAGIVRDTALDAKYYYDGVTERLLYINEAKANAALAAGLSGASFTAEMRLITVNDSKYGGGGGSFAVYAGANSSSNEIALHELGHSFNDLGDEYVVYSGTYSGPEPGEVNLTKDPTGAKWAHWLGYNDPVFGTIGAYKGARYYPDGLYRPSDNSKMRSLGRPFDAVSREKIILDIYDLVDPLDSWLDNSAVLIDPSQIVVDLIDPNVIDVAWYVDGNLVLSATEEMLRLSDFDIAPGSHEITARAYDETDWVRIHQDKLQQTITWNVFVTAVPEPSSLSMFGIGLLCLAGFARARAQRGDRRAM